VKLIEKAVLVTQELNKLIKKNKINMTEHLTLETFKEKVLNYEINTEEWVYEGKIPCIIDFYASWCGPCKMIAPILEELSEEYKDKIIIYKIDTEKEQDLAAMFGIRSIPSILFVPMDGKPSMINGALPKKDFEKVIKDILLKEEE